jgi:hypothetical protein
VILPGKHIQADRSLLVLGGEVLALLDAPRTVSEVWNSVRADRAGRSGAAPLTYDWFVLALTFLNAVSAVRLDGGTLRREGGA